MDKPVNPFDLLPRQDGAMIFKKCRFVAHVLLDRMLL
jgi:hypothetical protein